MSGIPSLLDDVRSRGLDVEVAILTGELSGMQAQMMKDALESPDLDYAWRMLHNLPHYSTDLKAAWRIIERMQEKGWTFTVEGQRKGEAWVVTVTFDLESGAWVGHATMSEPAQAICHAARHALTLYNKYVFKGH